MTLIEGGILAGERLYGFRVCEQGERLYFLYGSTRAYQLAEVFKITAQGRTQKAYWSFVQDWICVNVKDSGPVFPRAGFTFSARRLRRNEN